MYHNIITLICDYVNIFKAKNYIGTQYCRAAA